MSEMALSNRFWSKVNITKDGCWNWTDGISRYGYGRIFVNHENMYAHRLCWEMVYGTIPETTNGLKTYICHTCDNRRCVNPNHLWLGNLIENIRDRSIKGRHPRAKFGWAEALEIRNSVGPLKPLAEKYGVSTKTISGIRCGRRWR